MQPFKNSDVTENMKEVSTSIKDAKYKRKKKETFYYNHIYWAWQIVWSKTVTNALQYDVWNDPSSCDVSSEWVATQPPCLWLWLCSMFQVPIINVIRVRHSDS